MKTIGQLVAALVIIGLMGYGGWQLERRINYKFSYQSQVQAEVQRQLAPLEQRVTELEREVQKLKK